MTFIHEFAVIRENVNIGKETIIGPFNVIETGATIGGNVTIQPHCVIARDSIVENNVFIGPHFSCANNPFIPEGEHGQSKNKKAHKEKPIHIQEYTRIGTRCTVAPGVTIGHHCFIQMNVNIYEDVPPYTTLRKNTQWPLDYDI